MDLYVELDGRGFTAEEIADIKLCLETLLAIPAGSQPLDRDLGIDLDGILDNPISVTENLLSLEIIEKTEKYEPRVTVSTIDFDTGLSGKLTAKIHFVKAER